MSEITNIKGNTIIVFILILTIGIAALVYTAINL